MTDRERIARELAAKERAEALTEAQRRWGDTAWVDEGSFCHVGYMRGWMRIEMGCNTSWKYAFEDADEKEAKK